ncbi:MAG: MBL fold metallo-hydrolase, partial [Aldersonia sp.]|nr:MBL fold metallo-hydrolase [Aldersonia sp.]
MTQGSFTFIGNATALISYGDLTLLTDPNFLHAGERAYLGHGLVSKRLREPAMSIDELPPLDAILLSHMHGDHWDRRAQNGLDRELPVITTEHAAKRLRDRGFAEATGLTTWQSHVVITDTVQVQVTSLPGRHAPRWTEPLHLLPPVMGSMLEFGPLDGPTDLRVYITGDTLLVDDLREIPRRYPNIDTGVFHLGGTTLPFGQRPSLGLMVTMDGRQGAEAVQLVDPDEVVPVHYDVYGVMASGLSDFL